MKLANVFLTLIFIVFFAISPVAYAADFSVHGYYRNRVVVTDNLDLQKKNTSIPYDNNRFGYISYNQMRLRLEPTFKLNDNLALLAQFDILDNILFGSRETRQLSIVAPIVGPQTLPAGAGSFYMTGPSTVGENGAINVRRLWADILTPIGKFRIGRQPSHWGLGIFQNDGNDIQSDFGDTADRILYAIQYDMASAGSITGGLFWDIAYEAQWDPRTTGLATNPPANSRDAQQYGAMVLYDQPEFTLGLFGGMRRRNGPAGQPTMWVTDMNGNQAYVGNDGFTQLYFADLYGRYTWENYKFQIEAIYIGGKVTTGLALNSIPFKGVGGAATCGSQGIICLPQKQTMQVPMIAFEGEAKYKFGGEWRVQAGYAPGDASPLSQKVTQLGFRPDYQIALMMFYMPLGTSPSLYGESAANPGGGTQKLVGGQSITSNFVNNALYVTAAYKHKFEFGTSDWVNWAKVGGKVITAWAPQKNTNVDFAELIGQANLPAITEKANSMMKRWYGLEFDLSAEAKLWEHLYTALEAGVLVPGREYDINVNLIQTGTIVNNIPDDKAHLGWMVRLTTFFEF